VTAARTIRVAPLATVEGVFMRGCADNRIRSCLAKEQWIGPTRRHHGRWLSFLSPAIDS
jgi:hypothetical protein